MEKYGRWNGRFLVWYGTEWKISGMEWSCMEDFACYGRFTFHSIVCPASQLQV